MLRNVLVPLDGSSFGEHALPLAVAVARKAGAKLHMAHVHIEPPPAVIAGVAVLASADADTRKDEVAYLEGVRRRLAEAGTVNVESGLLAGNIASALADYAGRVQADLIVM